MRCESNEVDSTLPSAQPYLPKLDQGSAVDGRVADLHYAAESGKSPLVDFLASKQLWVVEEITEKPAQLPECFGRAVNTPRRSCARPIPAFEGREPQEVERLLRMSDTGPCQRGPGIRRRGPGRSERRRCC
jgi:hypothetical protein